MVRNFSIAAGILLFTLATLSSCKKSNVFGGITPNVDRPIVEFTDAKKNGSLSLSYSTQWITTDLTEVRFNPRSTIAKDAVVKVVENNSIIDNYNNANGTGYTSMPAGSYELQATEITLTSKERKKMIPIKVMPATLVGGAYAIGLTISTSTYGEINPVAHDVLVFVVVKNNYEGQYHSTGQRILYAGPTLASGIANTVTIDVDKYLYTVDQATVVTDVADLVGSAYMFLQVNPNTNAVSVQPSTVGQTFELSNNGPCTYDPGSRTFSLNYKYYNSAGNLRTITETIVGK